jgi:hypothetical protein
VLAPSILSAVFTCLTFQLYFFILSRSPNRGHARSEFFKNYILTEWFSLENQAPSFWTFAEDNQPPVTLATHFPHCFHFQG